MSKKGALKLSSPESLGQIIVRGGAPSPRKKRQRLELLRGNWRHIAGERAWQHSRPTRLSKGTLTVAADGASWASELSIQAGSLLEKIEAIVGRGVVQRIKVQGRADGAEGAVAGGGSQGLAGTEKPGKGAPRLGEKVESELEKIGQEETRSALERLLKEIIASKQYEQDSG